MIYNPTMNNLINQQGVCPTCGTFPTCGKQSLLQTIPQLQYYPGSSTFSTNVMLSTSGESELMYKEGQQNGQ